MPARLTLRFKRSGIIRAARASKFDAAAGSDSGKQIRLMAELDFTHSESPDRFYAVVVDPTMQTASSLGNAIMRIRLAIEVVANTLAARPPVDF
jgi:hypothetical protein